MMQSGASGRFHAGIGLAAFAVLGMFLLYPLWLVLRSSVQDDAGGFTLAAYAQILSSRYYLGSLGNSLAAGAMSMALASCIGVPLAFCLARLDVPGKPLLLALATVLPSFVGAYALVLLFGRVGVVTVALRSAGVAAGSIYGMAGIVAVFTLTLYPYVLLPTLAGFRAVDASMEEAARNLGASRWHAFRTVLFPIVAPSVLAGALLVFIEALENYGVPAVLAEDRPFLALDIFKLFAGESDPNAAAAGALSVLLVGCTALVLLLQRSYLARRRFPRAGAGGCSPWRSAGGWLPCRCCRSPRSSPSRSSTSKGR